MKKSAPLPTRVTLRIPATTANLGPGFDTLGVALKLYNRVTVLRRVDAAPNQDMSAEAARAFFTAARQKPFPFQWKVTGDVPMSRGLGSSVTVRLGLVAGLNELSGTPLTPEEVLHLVIQLEGHPDNAVPAFYGGFAACAGHRFVRAPVTSALKFVALIPDFNLETKKARAVLPKQVPLAHAIANLQNSTLITAAFLQRHYAMLAGLFTDHLHQPYRAKLIPCWDAVSDAAQQSGALGFYLSGAGSTLMALTLKEAPKIAAALEKAAQSKGVSATVKILTADAEGLRLRVHRGR